MGDPKPAPARSAGKGAAPRALVVYCHPDPQSFSAAVRDRVIAHLRAAGAEIRLHDLYAAGFAPALTGAEWAGYAKSPENRAEVASETADLMWCDTLILVYPTWWFGAPAMLKGWMDRVLLPGVAFHLPDRPAGPVRPALTGIVRLGLFTTCGTSWWQMWLMGAPGHRMVLRGVRALLSRRVRVRHATLYRIDGRTSAERAAHLDRVGTAVDRLLATRRRGWSGARG